MSAFDRDKVLDHVPPTWSTDPEAFSVGVVAAACGLEPEEVRNNLGDEHDLLDAWYARTIDQVASAAAEMEVDGGAPFEDRLGSRAFMLLDALESDIDFVRPTFGRHADCWGTPFRERLGVAIDAVLDGPDVPGVNRAVASAGPVRGTLVEAFVRTLALWLADTSEGRERATALVDKLLAFFAAVVTNRGIESGLDLARYAAGAGFIPFVGDWLGSSGRDA